MNRCRRGQGREGAGRCTAPGRPTRPSVRLTAGLAAGLLLWAAAATAPARADLAGHATLSWSPDEALAHIDWPIEGAGPAHAFLDLYLTVNVSSPVDSLGFFLRWAAEQAGAEMRLVGITSLDGQVAADLSVRGPHRVQERRLQVATDVVSVAELLAKVALPQADGTWRYPLRLQLACDGGPMTRLQAYGVVARGPTGKVVQLGSPAVSSSGGWRLLLPPQVTAVENVINRRFLVSDLTLHGLDLDQVAGLVIIDSHGRRVPPNLLKSRVNEQMTVTVPSKLVKAGPCVLELVSGNCLEQRIAGILEATVLDIRQPGDDNLGSVPVPSEEVTR